MAALITKTGSFALGGNDVRDFKEGDVHVLHPDHEKELIDAGYAVEAKPADAETAKAVSEPNPVLAESIKVSQAPQAVDTAAVAARIVADGATHDSEGGVVAGSTNNEGPSVAHVQDLVSSETVKASDEAKKADEKEAKEAAKAEKPKAAVKPHGKK